MAEDRKEHWDHVYATKAEAEVSWFEAVPEISLGLISRTGLPKSAPVIDIGGGLSRLADELCAAGYSDVTILDISAEALARAQNRPGREGRVRSIVADITSWRPDRRYAIWHDRAVLHFLIEPAQQAAYRAALLEGLQPGGQAVIGTFAPTGPERCSGLPVRRYGKEELSTFLGPEFTLAESFEVDHGTPMRGVQRFHFARFVRT